MTDRAAEILRAAIKEFISTGEPISSKLLFARHDFGIRPAMIRHELCELEELGFLEQPYHSAGRVPSDRGYKFFAEQVLKSALPDPRAVTFEEMLEHGNWGSLLKEFSRQLGMVGVLAEPSLKNIHKDGLEYLFDRMDIDSRDALSGVVRDIEEIEDHLQRAKNIFSTEDFLEVFIGKESPITKSDYLSVVAADYGVGNERVFFFAIGPKRMDYEKTAKVLKGFKNSKATKKVSAKGGSSRGGKKSKIKN